MRQAVAPKLAGGLGVVAILPVDGAGRVLHQQPRRAPGQAAGEVGAEGELDLRLGLPAGEVVVVGHDVDLVGPGPVVEVLEVGHHEVGGHRNVRGHLAQHVALGAEAVEQLVGREAAKVEPVRRVAVAGRPPWWLDLLPVVVVLAPERRAPRIVQRVERLVPLLQPAPERRRTGVAVAVGVVAAVLVVHVPHRQRGMRRVSIGQCGGEGEG